MLAKVKMSRGGKISIPSNCRKFLNVSDGDELLFDVKDDQIVISSVKFALQKVRKVLKDSNSSGKSLVEELLKERKMEQKDE